MFHAFCPPHFPTMADAVEAFADRKFGPGARITPTHRGRGASRPGSAPRRTLTMPTSRRASRFSAKYALDTWGKFPGTVPSVWVMNFPLAQHIDLDFYDHYFREGAYLSTHREHMRVWH
jgi:hypothetical protein